MFPGRYFPGTYYAPRYWPNVGLDLSVVAQLFGLNVLGEAPYANEGAVISTPIAGQWYNLDLCWGWLTGQPAGTIAPQFTCPGATIDTGYYAPYHGHTVGAAGRRLFDQAWSPSTAVYLTDGECAAGYWRVLFPSQSVYTVTLIGVGSVPITIGSQAITVSGSLAPPTVPTIVRIDRNPLNRQPSVVLQLIFNGTYPAGGLDLTEDAIGLRGMLHAEMQDTANYRFRWSAGKLQVFTSSGEASGTVSFTTLGLFVASIG